MTLIETIEVLKKYVESTTESYLDCYGLKDKFPSIKQKAAQALQSQSVLQYINDLMNGMKLLLKQTGQMMIFTMNL